MARRPAAGRGSDTAVYEETAASGHAPGPFPDPWDLNDEPRTRRRRGGRWGGSGGRWWVWVGRGILWALIIVILVNGVRAPFERFTESGQQAPAVPKAGAGAQFPASAASAFALQFANVYLNYDQQTAPDRQQRLQAFLPDGADGQFGWNGVGKLQVQSVQVAGVDAKDANNAVVTVLARAQDRWLRLAVPVYAKDGALVISGRPALLPPPTKAQLPQTGTGEQDTALQAELQQTFDAFFRAYADSDDATLARFSDGPPITGLAKSVQFARLVELNVPKGAAGQRVVTATVAWQIPGTGVGGEAGELAQTYELTIVRKGTGWNVRDIHAVTEPAAS